MSPRTAHRLAWFSAALAGALVTCGLLLSLLAFAASAGRAHLAPHQFFNPLITLAFSVVGALVASRHSRNPIGWILSATGFLSALDLLALGYSLYGSVTTSNALPGVGVARWLDAWIWLIPTAMPMTFLLLLFPDGRLISPRWQPVAWLVGLGLAAGVLGFALNPGLAETGGRIQVSLSPVATAAAILESAAWPLLGVGWLSSLMSLVIRFRRSSGVERDQLKWLVYAVGLGLVIAVLGNTIPLAAGLNDPLELGIISTDVWLVAIIVAIGIAIVRHHLYDINLLINRTLVYGALSALVVAIYVLVVGSFGALFQARGSLSISLLATGLVAVSFQPMRDQLQRGVNRLMYGERDDPYAVLSRLGERLERVVAPEALLETLVETIGQSLKLPYAAIVLRAADDARITAAWGQPGEALDRFPLMFQTEMLGHVLVGRRASEEAFSAAEKNLLMTIARQAGAAVHAAQLTVDLQRSRERLVTAREEERRRLRRDLHDGLGPTLAALHLQAGTLRRVFRSQPEAANALIDDFQHEIRGLIDNIRQLAYELRPPALDELGLVGAIQSRAAQISQGDGRVDQPDDGDGAHNKLHIYVAAPADLPPLPAAVEVAAYWIVQEALLNVVRHARASKCTVYLHLAEGLQLEIRDDGTGRASGYQAGVGILSMRERAAELGGWCSIEAGAEGGTVVRAHLPGLEG